MRTPASKPGGAVGRFAIFGLAMVLFVWLAAAIGGHAHASQVVGTLIVIAAGTGLGRAALRMRDPGPWRVVGWFGAAATACGVVCALALIWEPDLLGSGPSESHALLRLGVAAAAAGCLIADVARLQAFELRGLFGRLVRALALFTAFTLALIVFGACAQAESVAWLSSILRGSNSTFWVGFGICLTFSHLAVPVLARMEASRERARRERATDRATLTLQCPRCLLWVQMHSGMILCPGCSLQVRIEFEEPRCRCGYPLHRLSGPNCPECGLEVPPEKRWGAARGPASPAPAVTPTDPLPQP